jgi:hypothetical protein
VIFLQSIAQLQVLGIFHVEKTGAAPDHEDLADFFFEGELVQCLLGPFVSGMGLMDWAGMLVFILGLGGGCGTEYEPEQ